MKHRLASIVFPLTVTILLIAGVAFASDGTSGKIVFSSNRDGKYELFLMNPDGTGQRKLPTTLPYNRHPVWSPDGTMIAFEIGQEIYAINADGSNERNLTNNDRGTDLDPAWSPDGSKIAFSSTRDGQWEIYVMNADGSGQTNLTNHTSFDRQPAWSPDGAHIVFVSSRDANTTEIYVMDADGDNVTRLTQNQVSEIYPDWSPDGLMIAFNSYRNGNSDIYLIPAAGGPEQQVTNHPAADVSASWSADGSQIAFASTRNGNLDLFLMNADGSGLIQLTDDPGADVDPDMWPLLPPPPVEVSIDIKPGSDPNCVNSDGHGVIPVAILSAAGFDATQVDPATVSLDGQAVRVVGMGNSQAHTQDVNADGLLDLIVQIEDADGTYEQGDGLAYLSGRLFMAYGGTAVMGSDYLCIVP